MCHHIEDPTFDATAVVTNPRAQVRPIHRPPRVPADRVPHCHWRVRVEPDAAPVEEIALTGRVRASRLAQLATALPASDGGARRPRRLRGPVRSRPPARGPVPCGAARRVPGVLPPGSPAGARPHDGDRRALGRGGGARDRVGAVDRHRRRRRRARRARRWTSPATTSTRIATLFQLHPAFHPREYVDFRVERARRRGGVLHRRLRGARRGRPLVVVRAARRGRASGARRHRAGREPARRLPAVRRAGRAHRLVGDDRSRRPSPRRSRRR